jgi:hypothetical protein
MKSHAILWPSTPKFYDLKSRNKIKTYNAVGLSFKRRHIDENQLGRSLNQIQLNILNKRKETHRQHF